MDKFIYLLLTFIIICGNAATVRTQDTTYFEGEIQYTVSYQSLDPDIPNSYFYENYGDSSVVFLKEDIYLVWKNSAGPDGPIKQLCDLRAKVGYVEFENIDTIYRYSLSSPTNKLLSLKLDTINKREILGDRCSSVIMEQEPLDEPYLDKIVSRHYFSKKYRLNRKLYKDFLDFNWNEFVDVSGAISLRDEVSNLPFYKSVTQATGIKARKIRDEELILDPDKVIVDIN